LISPSLLKGVRGILLILKIKNLKIYVYIIAQKLFLSKKIYSPLIKGVRGICICTSPLLTKERVRVRFSSPIKNRPQFTLGERTGRIEMFFFPLLFTSEKL